MDHDGSNIIFATVVICHINEHIANFLRAMLLTEDPFEVLVTNHFPEAIRAQQESITGLNFFLEDIHLNIFMSGPQGTINQIALRMCIDIVR